MKPELLHILQHSLGLDSYGRGRQYRNHFATSAGTTDWPFCVELCRMGLMKDGGFVDCGQMTDFFVTPEGVEAVRLQSSAAPRLTGRQQRYRDWLNADSGMTFIEWLKKPLDTTTD